MRKYHQIDVYIYQCETVSNVSVNIFKNKSEITRDGHLSQTYEQPWQNQLYCND